MNNGKFCQSTRNGYECSTAGDSRFSALTAKMPDNRTIEMWYQCDIKRYDLGGTNWKLGKGKPPLVPFNPEQLYELYLSLWRIWAIHNVSLMNELKLKAEENHNHLSDRFARPGSVNQARALCQILNEWFNDKKV